MPLLLLISSSFCSIGTLFTMYKIWKEADLYFMNNVSPLSLSILTVLNFQFFGVYMVLGLSYAPQYFQYLTVAGINCFLASVTSNKLSFLLFMSQNANHPMINENGFRSPRVRFYLLLVFSELVFFILAFVFIRFPYFSWYISAFYTYPLFHIMKAVYTGNRNHFRW